MMRRSAFTIIELLVVLAVISLILALILPAVQQARAASRFVQCQNNLRQIGLACHAYVDAYDMLPAGARDWTPTPTSFSIHSRLLPFLEEDSLYLSINFSMAPDDAQGLAIKLEIVEPIQLATFVCPGDDYVSEGRPANNYRFNMGSTPVLFYPDAEDSTVVGPIDALSSVKLAQISDGLSQTALLSERVIGDGNDGWFTPSRDVAILQPGCSTPRDNEFYRQACALVPKTPDSHDSGYGGHWIAFGYRNTLYNHVFTPNSNIPDCKCGTLADQFEAVATARSGHTGGVVLGLCDGSSRFIHSAIDQRVWRALGTRNGSEHVDF